MKQPDYELMHQLMGKLNERLESVEDTEVSRQIRHHLRKRVDITERKIDGLVGELVDDIYYLNEVLDAAS